MQIPQLRVPLPEDDTRQALTRLIASLAAESAALADLMENRRRAPADSGAAETERLLQSAARLQMVLELLLAQAGGMLAREESGE